MRRQKTVVRDAAPLRPCPGTLQENLIGLRRRCLIPKLDSPSKCARRRACFGPSVTNLLKDGICRSQQREHAKKCPRISGYIDQKYVNVSHLVSIGRFENG